MWRTEKTSDKWSQPGWRTEQKYSNKVLIGNWVEERLQFSRECRTANSTNRLDYRPQWDHQPDTFVRRAAMCRGEGLPSKLLLAHHDPPPSHFLVSQYDEMYGRRADSAMPKRRSWDSNKLAWVPECSDHAAKAPPTNFGLAEARWARAEERERSGAALSVYRSAYPPPPLSALCHPRHAGGRWRQSQSQRPRPSHLPASPSFLSSRDLEVILRLLGQGPDTQASRRSPLSTPASGLGWLRYIQHSGLSRFLFTNKMT